MATFGRLAGYHDKLHVDSSIALSVSQMIDIELMERFEEAQAQLAGQGDQKHGDE